MRKRDLFSLCMQNLFRRKSRTILTVLGVVIGCCAIVIMVSIGIGSREAQEKMLSQMGDLTLINVYYYSWDSANSEVKLNDAALDSFRAIPGVELVTPMLEVYDIPIKICAGVGGRYETRWVTLVGMSDYAPERLEYGLLEGEYAGEGSFAVLVGERFAYNFADTKRPEGYNMVQWWRDAVWDEETGTYTNLPDPYFNVMDAPMELRIEIEGKNPIKQKLTVTGVMKEDYSKNYVTSEGMIMRLDDLLVLREQYRRAAGIKTENEDTYEQVIVKVKEINQVGEVEKTIKAAGYNTSSMESIREPMEAEARQQQMILGGLGAISLLVAAIGIMNTMIMSISERTREIGIMKALGCFLRDIRTEFLMEAGMIGILGGVIGLILSFAISIIMNVVSSQMPVTSVADLFAILGNVGSRMSVIPAWLALFALVFSALIGLVSGYYPASRAVRISALEAIKRE